MECIHSLDQEDRLRIPVELRKKIGQKVVLSGRLKDCLCLYAQNTWEKLAEKWKGSAFEEEVEARRFRRRIFSQSMDGELDDKGKILIPGYLKKHAFLEEKAVIFGNDHLEIWNKEKWQERKEGR